MLKSGTVRTLIAATMLLLLTATASATVHQVTVGNNFFSPLKTTVSPGDTVRWIWAGGMPHTTTSDPSSPKQWNSPTSSAAGFEYEVEFTSEDGSGPFPYHCAIHASTMKDTIFVAIPPSCCDGRVGDANGLGGDEPTIGDISAIIAALFIQGSVEPIAACVQEADINQSGGTDPAFDDITIGDISVLISYLFITGPYDPESNPSGTILPNCL